MASPQLPFAGVDRRFTQKSGDLYDSMVQRFKEKRDKNDRVTRIGRELPFDKARFRQWLLAKLGGSGGVVKCLYCAEFLSIDTLTIDHREPVKQGGSLGLENLDLVCDQDNQQKGGMCGDCYLKLLNWSAGESPARGGLHPECRKDMLHRLAISVKLAAQQRFQIAKAAKEKAKQISQPREEEVF